MKKLLAFSLSLCMILSCMASPALAAEVSSDTSKEVSDVSPSASEPMPQGDLTVLEELPWQTLDGTSKIYPYNLPAGKELMFHLHINLGNVKIEVRKQGSLFWTNCGTYSENNKYITLISSTQAATYQVRFKGTAAHFGGELITV